LEGPWDPPPECPAEHPMPCEVAAPAAGQAEGTPLTALPNRAAAPGTLPPNAGTAPAIQPLTPAAELRPRGAEPAQPHVMVAPCSSASGSWIAAVIGRPAGIDVPPLGGDTPPTACRVAAACKPAIPPAVAASPPSSRPGVVPVPAADGAADVEGVAPPAPVPAVPGAPVSRLPIPPAAAATISSLLPATPPLAGASRKGRGLGGPIPYSSEEFGVYLRGLSQDTTRKVVEDWGAHYGNVVTVKFQHSRTHTTLAAYVDFDHPDAAQRVLSDVVRDGRKAEIQGVKVSVLPKISREQRIQQSQSHRRCTLLSQGQGVPLDQAARQLTHGQGARVSQGQAAGWGPRGGPCWAQKGCSPMFPRWLGPRVGCGSSGSSSRCK